MPDAFNFGFYFGAGVAAFVMACIIGGTVFASLVALLRRMADQADRERDTSAAARTADRKPPRGGSGTAPPTGPKTGDQCAAEGAAWLQGLPSRGYHDKA